MKFISVAALVATLASGAVQAATLSGTFDVTVYNYNPVGTDAQRSADSTASGAVLTRLQTGSIASVSDTFTYTGALNFSVTADQRAQTSIGQWLATAGGTVIGLDSTIADRQLSFPTFSTASFFVFAARFVDGFNAVIRHDDGISVLDDGVAIRERSAPTTVVTTSANGFNGGTWSLYYVAANGNPSVLHVDADRQPTPVPVPAALPLLAAGVGALAFFRRRAARA